MQASAARMALAAAIGIFIVAGCPAAPPSATQPAASAPGMPAATAAGVPDPAAGQPLLPDPSAGLTIGDTVRLAAGEEGDQAEFTALEAMMLPPGTGGTRPRYAFLVEITGLDDIGFLYNVLDFTLFDDQSFQYLPLSAGGQEPGLEFGDLAPGRKVRGWVTFEGPAQSEFVELEYAPELAIDVAHVRVLVP